MKIEFYEGMMLHTMKLNPQHEDVVNDLAKDNLELAKMLETLLYINLLWGKLFIKMSIDNKDYIDLLKSGDNAIKEHISKKYGRP